MRYAVALLNHQEVLLQPLRRSQIRGAPPNTRLLQSRQPAPSRATLAVTTLAAQQNRRDVRTREGGDGLSKQIPWLRVFVEGVVIVGSILLAFGLQAWWDGQVDRQTELTILGELHTALSSDLEVLEGRLDRFRRIESRGAVLTSYLRSGAPYADSLDAYFGTVYGFGYSLLNKGGYESLKSQPSLPTYVRHGARKELE